ncbi:hypothetical protein [Aurantiacibacter sediminis]|uniref:UrcA family protein n=1 Tax=Aurantiacibacter sediminis TaxID=2793064 RepID=A0ABS0N0F8_9SPHN|nr:hypothetical protein [Aurantiacibacter sediminis]MBH5321456.1 hypothetical protein [Aurantiacibacter sediminis]
MTNLLALALLASPLQAQEVPAEVENQILVMAERLRSIEVNVGQDREGNWHCSLSASSGSEIIDSRLCRTTTHCVRENGDDRAAIEECVRTHRSRTLADFRQRLIEERQ